MRGPRSAYALRGFLASPPDIAYTPGMADCPKCPYTAMDEVDSGLGFAIDECPECGGRWYDLGELEKASKDPEKFRAAAQSGPMRPRSSDRLCPRCKKAMVNGGMINELLRVDTCESCRGIWLDKHEITLVDKLLGSV